MLAVPPILTNAYFAIDSVDRDVVEAARGMGLSERQVLLQGWNCRSGSRLGKIAGIESPPSS